MNKSSVKYLQGVKFSHLTVVEKTEIKNLGRPTPDFVRSQAPSSRIQTLAGKFNPVMCTKHRQLSGCAERNAFSLVV
jgi:hypothetical protein